MRRAPYAFALLAFAAPGLAVPGPAAASLAASIVAAASQAPRGSAAWVRLNPVPGRPSAGYLTITAMAADRLTAATAPGVRIELHSMSMAGGVMKMARLDGLDIPANTATSFAPGGNHLMIFGLAGTPKTLPITLRFASGKTATVSAEVRAAGADATPKAGAEATTKVRADATPKADADPHAGH